MKLTDEPTLLQLRVFTTVVETGSLTRACEVLSYLNPSSVSYHIHQLEELYGVALLERSRHGMVPTGAGTVLYESARQMLDALEHASSELQVLRGTYRGAFNIGTPQATFFLLTHTYRAFAEQFPSVDTGLFIYPDSARALDSLLRQECHVTLLSERPSGEALETHFFAREPLLMVASVQHRLGRGGEVSRQLLERERLVSYPAGSESRQSVDSMLGRYGLRFGGVLEAPRTSQVKEAVLRGKGVAVLPESVIYVELEFGLLAPLRCPGVGELFRDVYVAFLRKSPSRRMIEDLLNAAETATRGSLRYDRGLPDGYARGRT